MTEQLDLNIEGTVEDERQLRIIHEPTKDEIMTMRERLSIKTKGQLQTMATPYIGLLRKLRLRYACPYREVRKDKTSKQKRLGGVYCHYVPRTQPFHYLRVHAKTRD